jgi:hypothetical protein
VSDLLHRIKCPVLVVGAAQDQLIPSSEAMHVAASLGDLATLIWYEESGHCAYDQIDDWMEVAAQWLFGAFGFEEPESEPVAPTPPAQASTQVDYPFSTPPAPVAPAALADAPPPTAPAEEDVVISVDPAAIRSDLSEPTPQRAEDLEPKAEDDEDE